MGLLPDIIYSRNRVAAVPVAYDSLSGMLGVTNIKRTSMRKKEDLLQLGWLILRAGIGISILLHGIPKLMGGVETWTYIGGSMAIFGITFAPAFWGLMAAVAEAVGGALFALGLLFRPAALMLTGTMVVALATHLAAGDDFMVFGHALDLLIVFAGAILIGAGRYSLDAKLLPKLA